MSEVIVNPDIAQDPWTGLDPVATGEVSHIGLLRHGTRSGRATVALVITTDDGQQIVGQITWRMFRLIAEDLADSPVVLEET